MLNKPHVPQQPCRVTIDNISRHILMAYPLPGMFRFFTHITWLILSSALRDRFRHDSHYTNAAQRGAVTCPGSQCWGVAEWGRDPGESF